MTTMSIKTFFEVAPRLPGTTSVLLRAGHGVGKSQVVRQLAARIAAAEGIANFPVIDRRCSQMSEGDMIGLPSTDGAVTRFNPPDWYKAACDAPVCLFLDELNRATPEVMQAAFQIVLDRELNGWKLHPQTRVYSAVNTGGSYTVNEIDPALLDRFWAIDLTPTEEDLLEWGREKNEAKLHGHNLAPLVVDFLTVSPRWIDPAADAEPAKVNTSRRSWERLGDALAHAGVLDNPDDKIFYPLCLGYVGTEATIAFVDYSKNEGAHVTGEEVLQDYGRVKRRVTKLGQEKQNVLVEKVSDYVKSSVKSLTSSQSANLKEFITDLPAEIRVSLWSKLTSAAGADNPTLTKQLHEATVAAILEVFGTSKDGANAAQKFVAGDKDEDKKGKKGKK